MPPHPHCHWRGVKVWLVFILIPIGLTCVLYSTSPEWRDLGLPMSTVSDEACKMYDAALTQAVNHFDDEAVGGMEGCMKKALEADPDFVMGHAIQLHFTGKKIRHDPEFAQAVYKLAQLAQKPNVSPWERQHATAVKLCSEGFTDRACNIFEDILVEYPYDMLAARNAYELHLFSGNSAGLRDSCGRVLPLWKKDTPLYGDLLGMYGFGLEETNIFAEGEKAARKALEINRHDAWANHTVAHCKEMTGQVQDGINFMQETENYWNDSMFLCHNYWHWALFYVENGDFESAIGILDTHILPVVKKHKHPFNHSDAASLCFRLEAEGYNVSDRWKECYEAAKTHTNDFAWAFYDLHHVMSMTAAQKRPEVDCLVNGIRKFIQEDISDYQPVYKDVVLPISEAFQAWDDKNFDRAVELMKPLRYKVYAVGGSNAQTLMRQLLQELSHLGLHYLQRDIFNLFTVHAALRSTKPENQKYAKHLLLERKCVRGETPLINRLMQQCSASE